MPSTIYCDESGNSGANLPEAGQPFFVLASNNFTEDEANSLLAQVRSPQGGEPKFATLRKSADGVRRLTRFLGDPILQPNRIFADGYHKRYMIVTKMVDLVAETLIHGIGGDLYERGGNIAMSNLLFYCMPVFCGEERTRIFLESFVDLARQRRPEDADAFYEAGDAMLASCSSERFKEDLFFFTERALFGAWWDDHINPMALDPAIPALFRHIVEWTKRGLERFDVVHDNSKPVLASTQSFEEMMALAGEQSQEIGRDRRKMLFPLRASSLTQADSKLVPQLQVADICAGLVNHFLKGRGQDVADPLSGPINEFVVGRWEMDALFPSPAVTPEALGTEEMGGTDSVQAMMEYLLNRRAADSPG
jgi:hypothetical protein